MKKVKNSGDDEPYGTIRFTALQRWYCPNCGQLAAGYPNNKNITKVECNRCHITMVKKQKGRHHDTIELYENVSEQ